MKIWQGRLFALAICFVSMSGVASATNAIYPTIARDSNGNAVAVWIDNTMSGSAIRANTYIEGSWGATAATIMTGGVNTQVPVVAVVPIATDDISAVIVWADDSTSPSGHIALYSAMLPSVGDGWTSPDQLPLDTDEDVNYDYAVRTHTDGTAVLVYTSYNSGTSDQPVKSATATIDNTNTWTTPTPISDLP